jgi:hypothetical protein
MWNWLKRRLTKRPRVESYWWKPSPPYEELPPLANDPRFEMRISKYHIAEYRMLVE